MVCSHGGGPQSYFLRDHQAGAENPPPIMNQSHPRFFVDRARVLCYSPTVARATATTEYCASLWGCPSGPKRASPVQGRRCPATVWSAPRTEPENLPPQDVISLRGKARAH